MDTCGVPRHIWNRWITFWWMLRHPHDPRPVLQDLGQRYGELHRRYHTLDHIAACLRELDSIREHLDFAQLLFVEGAIWFHDAVYDPTQHDNEERSAELARTVFASGASTELHPAVVAKAILLSNHRDASDGPRISTDDQRFPLFAFLDIDLSILGQDDATYRRYAEQIRQEYLHVPDDAFRAGRAALLEQFLKRTNIYRTAHFHGKYEAAARANITFEIARLRAGR
ncbi:MAG: metal-dependent phosphohydrolase [bacterium]|nr:metal-dependent phosphohydrolase [bacterium]